MIREGVDAPEYRVCMVDKCTRPAASRGMCQRHYTQAWKAGRYKKTRLPIVCFVKDCTAPAKRLGMCMKHWSSISQMHRLRTDKDFHAYRLQRVIEYQKLHPEKAARNIIVSKRVTRWTVTLATACANSARRYGYACDVDADYLQLLWDEQGGICYWLHVPMVPSVTVKDPRRPSVDKLKPALGYTRGNIVLSTMFANLGRNDFAADAYREFVEELRAKIRG